MFQVIHIEILIENITRNLDHRKILKSVLTLKKHGLHTQETEYNLYINDTPRLHQTAKS